MSRSRTAGVGLRGAFPFSITLLLVPLIVVMALDELPDFVPWVIPWVILPLIPFIKIVETLFKSDVPNLDPSTPGSKVFWHIAVIVSWAACYPFLVIFILWAVCNIPTLNLYERMVLLVFCGMLGRLTTIASHDLIHRRQLWARRLGEFMMSAVAMPHFYTEHVYMHHPNVATPRDKESARLGQSYYNYFLTVIPYAYSEAILTQYRRLARRGLSFWHRSNPVWRWIAMWVAWIALAFAIGGWLGLAAWIFIVLFAAWGMRAVDYIQHYGLQRILKPTGKYENIQLHHSWNYSSSSNYLYFSIQRHSDHHRSPATPYPLLRSLPTDKAPSLPANYGSMLTLALFPSAWFRKINPLVEKWRRDFYPDIKDWRALSSEAYRQRPESLHLISEIIHSAPCLADYMERCYPLIDSIGSRQFQQITIPENTEMEPDELLVAQRGLLRLYYGHEFGYEEMIEDFDLAQADIGEEVADSLQIWCNDHAFQLGVRMMRGHLPPGEAGRPLSNMADVAITLLAQTVLDEFVSYRGPMSGDGVAVVSLGRLGARRMTFESEVEIVFLSDDVSASGENEFILHDHAREFCGRFNKLTERLAINNLLFKSVHARSPAGEAGNVTGTLARFANGHQDSDSNILREVASARVVCAFGDNVEGLTKRFEEAKGSILRRHAVSVSDGLRPLRGDERSLHAILEGPGGLDDLELAALWTWLRHVDKHPDIAFDSDPATIPKQLGEHGIIEPQTAEALAAAANFLLGLECVLSLVKDGKPDGTPLEDSVKATVVRACDAEEFNDVVAKAEEAAARVAAHLAAPMA